MSDLEFQAAIAGARAAASAVSSDVQKLPEDFVELQALHGIVTAIDYPGGRRAGLSKEAERAALRVMRPVRAAARA